MPPNQSPQRRAAGHRGCNRRAPVRSLRSASKGGCPPSLSCCRCNSRALPAVALPCCGAGAWAESLSLGRWAASQKPLVSAPDSSLLRRYRLTLCAFILGLVLSGITAFPLLHELDALVGARGLQDVSSLVALNSLDRWLLTVRDGLRSSYSQHPWLAYGTDWLAFAHLTIAVFCLGPLVDPLRNVWVLRAGVIACILVLPLALICGEIRQIPMGWRLIDCSFGVLGVIPLLYCLHLTKRLSSDQEEA